MSGRQSGKNVLSVNGWVCIEFETKMNEIAWTIVGGVDVPAHHVGVGRHHR